MPNTRDLLLVVAATLGVAANTALSQVIIDDRFDDDDVTTNTTGTGLGWNPTFASSTFEEANDVFSVTMMSGANSRALLSKETFAANDSAATFGTWTFTEMAKPDGDNPAAGITNFHMGFVDNNEPNVNDDGFDGFSNPIHEAGTSGANRAGLWVSFRAREDHVNGFTGALDGDEGFLTYVPLDAPPVLLGQWTWDRSVFEFNEGLISTPSGRSDRFPIDLIADDISFELSSDDMGYGLRFFSSDPTAILPSPITGTWEGVGIDDISSLDTVRAVGFAGQNGSTNETDYPRFDLDRVYIGSSPQRDADFSGLGYTWGARANDDGTWGDTDGWQVSGVNTSTIPDVVAVSRSADSVEILSGTVRVANADRGAWTVQVNNGATLEVASGRTLQVIDNEFGDAVDIQAGGSLLLGGTLDAWDIIVDGNLTFADGTLRVNNGTIGSFSTSSDATIANDDVVTVGQATLGAGDTLNKQRAGTLVLDQSGGANSFASGSTISIQQGTLAGINNASDNSLGSATVSIDGGTLQLSSSAAGATAFDASVAVNTSGTIRAAQTGTSLENESVTLGGTNGMTIAADQVATLETSDGYSMTVAGAVSGAGTLLVSDGASVDLAGNIAPEIIELEGDISNVTVGAGAVPAQAFQFSPNTGTPAMVIDFQLSGAFDVIVDENDDTFTGTVQLNNTSNDYTGVTRVVSGTLLSETSPIGDYNGDGSVTSADYADWKGSFGDAVAPGSGADGNGDGTVSLADYTVWRDNLGATGGNGLPAASLLQFEGSSVNYAAVLQTSQDVTRNIGAGAGEINWVGSGGFAAAGGGTVNVTLEGGAQLTWDSATSGFNGQSLKLGSASADGTIVVTNNIDLNNGTGVVELRDNQGNLNDVSELSGVISSTGDGSDVLRVIGQTRQWESGVLRLSGANTYSTLEIGLATVVAEDGVGLPSTANLRFDPEASRDFTGIYATSGTFTRNIGEGPGEVYWVPDPDGVTALVSGGFAAVGGDLTVTLEGGATLDPASADTGWNNGTLQLGSPVADGVVTFTNNTDGGGATLTFFETFDNPNTDADGVVISGTHTNLTNFRIDGDGPVTLTGNVETNNSVFVNNAGAGALTLYVESNFTSFGNFTAEFNNGVNVFINGTLSVDNTAQARNLSAIGGTGTIFMTDNDANGDGNQRFQIQNTGLVRPGADLDSVGTLTVDVTRAGTDSTDGWVRFQNGSIYELEMQNNGGSVENDLLDLTASDGFPDLTLGENENQFWNLQIQDLDTAVDLVSPTDEFDFITFNTQFDVIVQGEFINVDENTGVPIPGITDITASLASITSAQFDTSNAVVEMEVFNDASGRIYVTGLAPLAPGALQLASVPEPSTVMLATLLIAAGAFHVRRAAK